MQLFRRAANGGARKTPKTPGSRPPLRAGHSSEGPAPMSADAPELHLQRNQPPGVPPLSLTGERTLPDVPEENYWYRRHLVVYEWIRARVGGLKVVDMACGEGYGSSILGQAAAEAVGVDANPAAHQHGRPRYTTCP